MVIGNAGGGKSTLSAAVARRHALPCHAIDHLQWQPGWRRVPDDALRTAHDALLRQDRWVIDGYGPWFSVIDRLAACDTVILVDHPLRVHLWWAAKRQVKSLFRARPDGPPGCPMWQVTGRLFRMMWWLHRDMRPRLLRAVYQRRDAIRIIHIRSPRALNAFAANPV